MIEYFDDSQRMARERSSVRQYPKWVREWMGVGPENSLKQEWTGVELAYWDSGDVPQPPFVADQRWQSRGGC